MTETAPSVSAAFLDGVADSVRDALAALDRHEASLVIPPAPTADAARVWSAALTRLEDNLAGWQAILGAMADQVRTAQDDLSELDADLRRALDAFGAARKHLQGA